MPVKTLMALRRIGWVASSTGLFCKRDQYSEDTDGTERNRVGGFFYRALLQKRPSTGLFCKRDLYSEDTDGTETNRVGGFFYRALLQKRPIGLFCKRDLLQGSFAKETYTVKTLMALRRIGWLRLVGPCKVRGLFCKRAL